MTLLKRNSVYYAQSKLPSSLVENRSVRTSLKTKCKRKASYLSALIDNEVHHYFSSDKALDAVLAVKKVKSIHTSIRDGKTFSGRSKRKARTVRFKLSKCIDEWLVQKRLEKVWTNKSEEDALRKIQLLYTWIPKGSDLESYHSSDLRQLANKIKNALLSKGLAAATVNKHLQLYGYIWKWLVRHGYSPINPFEGMSLKASRRAQEQRVAFTDEQALVVLNKSREASLGAISGMQKRDYYQWLTVIGMYSGMRLNEVCQLYLDDIHQHESIWCFKVTDEREDQRVKTPSSVRYVPIHPKILKAGLLEYTDTLKAQGHDRLMPELSFSRDGYGKNASRWFNERFLQAALCDELAECKAVYHSYRHTVADKMMKLGVDVSIAGAVLGHAQSGETYGRYGKGYSVQQLRQAIESISYEVS
ncbi:tyrosine-type recombinase/integrase [Vibrio alginolyticus]|uniref:tyrosine-type recombinase/integrase n=1 Tax=Vibrio alginolyticus TaxID=663 RepID=UPI001BD4DAA4|nr:tyrosine-type recombinase/integrase [Vibrio alginolyticus]